MTLPEHLFDSEPRKLEILSLTENMLATLPENVFKPISFGILDLKDNRLTSLPENIFINHIEGYVQLKGNPWSCDNVFLKTIQSNLTKFDGYEEIVCSDGKPLREKIII